MAKFLDDAGTEHLVSKLMSSTVTINGQSIWSDSNINTGDITLYVPIKSNGSLISISVGWDSILSPATTSTDTYGFKTALANALNTDDTNCNIIPKWALPEQARNLKSVWQKMCAIFNLNYQNSTGPLYSSPRCKNFRMVLVAYQGTSSSMLSFNYLEPILTTATESTIMMRYWSSGVHPMSSEDDLFQPTAWQIVLQGITGASCSASQITVSNIGAPHFAEESKVNTLQSTVSVLDTFYDDNLGTTMAGNRFNYQHAINGSLDDGWTDCPSTITISAPNSFYNINIKGGSMTASSYIATITVASTMAQKYPYFRFYIRCTGDNTGYWNFRSASILTFSTSWAADPSQYVRFAGNANKGSVYMFEVYRLPSITSTETLASNILASPWKWYSIVSKISNDSVAVSCPQTLS